MSELSTKNYQYKNVTKTINSSVGSVSVVKFVKSGTSRIFWTPVFEGKRVTTTMFSRLRSAEKCAKDFIQWKKQN